MDIHFFQQFFHFSIIHTGDSSFVVEVILFTSVLNELEPILV